MRPFDLSICIVSWNTRAKLRELLGDLTQGDGALRERENREIIVCDNASTDGTAAMVAESFPQVTLIAHATNQLYARAATACARQARGEFIAFLNADVRLAPGDLDALVDYLRLHPEVGVCGPLQRRPSGRLESVGSRFHSLPLLIAKGLGLDSLRKRRLIRRLSRGDATPIAADWITGSCLVLRRSLGERLGFFDERYFFFYEDVDLCWRVKSAGYAVHVVPKIVILHAHAASSSQVSKLQKRLWHTDGFMRFVLTRYSLRRARVLIAYRLTAEVAKLALATTTRLLTLSQVTWLRGRARHHAQLTAQLWRGLVRRELLPAPPTQPPDPCRPNPPEPPASGVPASRG